MFYVEFYVNKVLPTTGPVKHSFPNNPRKKIKHLSRSSGKVKSTAYKRLSLLATPQTKSLKELKCFNKEEPTQRTCSTFFFFFEKVRDKHNDHKKILTEGRIRILHVTGIETPVTSFLRIYKIQK